MPLQAPAAPPFHVACAACAFAPLCLPQDYGAEEGVAAARVWRKSVKRGEVLFRRGEKFRGMHAVHSGMLKSFVVDDDGHGQVVDFHLPGDVVGLDGMDDGVHHCDAVALQDSQVCFIRRETAARMSSQLAAVQREFHRSVAREIARQQRATRELRRAIDADHRVARFLLDWAGRSRRVGLPFDELHLRMTRDDLGSLLGLSLETVSRAFTRLRRRGVIRVHRKHVAIPDIGALRAMACENVRARPRT